MDGENKMIEINRLTKGYSGEMVLSDVTLQLLDNQIYFLMGNNGSGKTTFIKCLLNLERYSGSILFEGCGFQDIRCSTFAIFDDIPMYNDLDGYQNIQMMLEDSMVLDKDIITQLHLLTNQKLKQQVKGYSLGERKKLALVAAILRKPKYLIVDEISNGLDIETLETLQERLIEISQNSLIIATGHHFEFYENITDKLLILRDKDIVHVREYKKGEGKLHDIYKKYIAHN